ncbi:MAG: NAD(P)/FAD-dependent oxidoreductase [Balneolaceae bacterium]|nr:NAD(P)/FAD-dependent oxidoreductase [Balneolaceae bacterium]
MTSTYDVDALVIGGGAAGLTAAGIAANFGARTALVEAGRLGGDCTWTGCVPSKTLLHAARSIERMREAVRSGWIELQDEPQVRFGKIVDHVHRVREEIYEEADHPRHFEALGIEVIRGEAAFTGPYAVEIRTPEGEVRCLSARYIFICTGSEPLLPPVEGLEAVDPLTSDTLFESRELPGRLAVIGGGPVGCEMAQAFRRLGSEVSLLEQQDDILAGDDPEFSSVLARRLASEGVDLRRGAAVEGVAPGREGEVLLRLEGGGELKADRLLVAAGRSARTKTLNLEAAGVDYGPKGIKVGERCRTSISHIYACGDVTGEYQFTHMSEHMAKVAVTHALLKLPMKMDRKHVPHVTFTEPEVGQVGPTEAELLRRGETFEVYRFPYSKVDRALTESAGEGLIKVCAKEWSGTILGAGAAGVAAGEIVSEYALAKKNGISLRQMADTIHPYPTYGLGARRAADQWYIRNQSEWQVKLLKKLFGYRGEVPDFSDPDRIV